MTIPAQNNPSNPGEAAQSPSPDQEFDAAMAELGGNDEVPAPAAADIPADVPLPGAAETPAPAPAAASEAPAAADAPAGDEPQDLWASADPKLREAYEKMQRDYELRFNSLKGRQSALDRELQAYRQQQTGGGQPKEQPQLQETPGAQPKANASASDPEQIQRLREDFPDLAGPLLDLFEAQQAKIQQLEQGVGGYTQEKAQEAEARQLQILEQTHPDWADAARDDRFEGWLGQQSTAVREAFARNANGWVDGADAALVIGKFKADVGFGARATPPPTTHGKPVQDDRRQRQLASGRDASTYSPSVSSHGPDEQDFDGWLDRFAADADRVASRV